MPESIPLNHRANTTGEERTRFLSQGAEHGPAGTRYRTWCKHDRVAVVLVDQADGVLRTIELGAEGGGYFSVVDPQGTAGDLYRYQFGESARWPDPASRWQPLGVHGPSMVINPETFRWTDQTWKSPSVTDLVIYELHIGAFTTEGTFRSAINRLEHLVSLGVNAIELMPIAEFPGARNWGYDGVSLYAPAHNYGHPDDLRSLVDAAHACGLAVILDVVYNHLGPDGNYLGVYHGDYFDGQIQTPWGDGPRFQEPAVRAFFAENALYWKCEFHFDGFRLDAAHAIVDSSERHILAEISERIHAVGGFVVAEDERNDPSLLRSPVEGGLDLDGCWADDFHHVIRVMLTGEREGYFENYEGSTRELAETLHHGWLYRGQTQKSTGEPRGGEAIELAPHKFVYCISNHDQTGNRAFGERLGQVVESAAYRAASALLCLVPYTPMLFMGQEWSASTPFQFFTNHGETLGKRVTAGRRREFRDFAAFRDRNLLTTIPDPQAAETFARSKLLWEERTEPEHAAVLRLYEDFLKLRRTHPAFRDRSRKNWSVVELSDGIIALAFKSAGEISCLVVIDLIGSHVTPTWQSFDLGTAENWEILLSSNDPVYGGSAGVVPFSIPTTLIMCATPPLAEIHESG